MKKRTIRADDIYNVKIISDNSMSPDSKHIIMSLMHAVREKTEKKDKGKEKKYAHLYLTHIDSGKTLQFTSGKYMDVSPLWSPDSRFVYFLSNRENEKQFQIYRISIDGGEAEKLTDMKGQFDNLTISPDGRKLAFIFKEKHENKDRDICLHYTKSFFKMDGSGYLDNQYRHIYTLNTKNNKITQLTKKEQNHWDIAWTSDSKNIIFMTNMADDPHLKMWEEDFYMIKAAGGRITQINTMTGFKGSPLISPCGNYMAFIGIKTKTDSWRNARIWLKDLRNKKGALCLNPKADYTVGNHTLNDMTGSHRDIIKWSDDGKYIYFQASFHGSTNLRRIRVKGKKDELVIDALGAVGNFDIQNNSIYHFLGTMTNPGELYEYNIDKKQLNEITDFNKWLDNIDLGKVKSVLLTNRKTPLQGWILLPPRFDKRKKYASILEIHGGPHLQYGELFMHEFYYLAAQGYVVYFCNPRGSSGYSETFTGAINNKWGTVDYDDIMHWTDYVQRKPYIDGRRMGVTGGSYGGYMTNWIIGHTKRFNAAVTQRSVSNLYSMWGSSDYNWGFQHEFGMKPPFENAQNYLRQSPIAYMKNAKTPTMVIHSLNDFRCAVEQGEQVYVALKYLGVDSELLLFPDEPHGLSRGGRTDRRIKRLEHIKGWFDRYLK